MRLADYIEQNASRIADDATAFARTQMPEGARLDVTALRDHIPQILTAIVRDLRTAQGPADEQEKAEGRAPERDGPESAASSHGRIRAQSGFDVTHMIAEYRALRAAILRLWAADKTLSQGSMDDMVRFNEAIDQAVAESLVDFTREVEKWRHVFLGVLGHDLRGPLAGIISAADVLSTRAAGTPYSGFAEHIAMSGRSVGRLIENLLVYTKKSLEAEMPLDRSTCELATELQSEIDVLRVALPKSVISFHVEGPTRGQFDASRLREALHNLVTNAFKYGEREAEIVVSLTGSPKKVQLTVCNSGVSLPPNWSSSMYEPLHRGARAADEHERSSLGLGLFVVHEVVKAHGGELTAASANGKTKFTLTLPTEA